MTVDILLTVYNGLPFVQEQLRSLQDQTHRDWRLWVRDDASTDGTPDLVRAFAADDGRIRLIPTGGERLGVIGGFAWLTDQVKSDSGYVMFCDADDCWLPNKIEITLSAMLKAEAEAGPRTPILVHTDLTVVDADLKVISDSFWNYEALRPNTVTLEQLLIRNTVTGCTAMINQPLRTMAAPIPPEARMHDWWLALVARCFGRIVPVPTKTILYRQHGRNAVGAKKGGGGGSHFFGRVRVASGSGAERQTAMQAAAAQATIFLRRYEHRMDPQSRDAVAGVLDYLTVRMDLGRRRRSSRVRPIYQQVAAGRYARLSNGLSSAIRDLIL